MNKNITKYLLIALLVIFGLFIVYDSISKLGMFEGMESKKEGMDDEDKEGMDDEDKEGMDHEEKEGMDHEDKEGMNNKKKEGMYDKKKEGLEVKKRDKTTQISPSNTENVNKSFTNF